MREFRLVQHDVDFVAIGRRPGINVNHEVKFPFEHAVQQLASRDRRCAVRDG